MARDEEREPSPVEQVLAKEAAEEEKRLAGVIGSVRSWLKKGGYPLEYEAEETFAEAGFRIRRGFHYVDPDTGKPRESDVIALRQVNIPFRGQDGRDRQAPVTIGFFVEGKHVEVDKAVGGDEKKGQPWVVFTSTRHAAPREGCPVFPVVSDWARYAVYKLIKQNVLPPVVFHQPDRPGYSLVVANAKVRSPEPARQGSPKEPRDDDPTRKAREALHQSVKGAVSWLPAIGSLHFPQELFLGFPVVLTDNDVFDCWFLDRTPEEKILEKPPREEIQPRLHTRVYWHGSSASPDYVAVDIVTRRGLAGYVRDMAEGCDAFVKLLVTHLPRWVHELHSGLQTQPPLSPAALFDREMDELEPRRPRPELNF